jgi:uncharacterized protein (TIGR02646 family)
VKAKRETGKTPSCSWPKIADEAGGDTVTLQTWLSRRTAQHCAYCDSLMGYSSRDTIDHFLPKDVFPCLAYAWRNLYLCCDGCQRKGVRYDKKALRPDEEGYSFYRYFRFHADGRLTVIAEEESDRKRAEVTLDVLDLNDEELVKDRSREYREALRPRRRPLRPGLDPTTALQRARVQESSYEDRPFRFLRSSET